MNAREYFRGLQTAISEAPYVVGSNITFDETFENECYIRGALTLSGGLELHIAEYVTTEPDVQRSKYRYHLQTTDGALVTRWDNVPHHRHITTFPNHRHDATGSVHPSPPMDLFQVLNAIIPFLPPLSND